MVTNPKERAPFVGPPSDRSRLEVVGDATAMMTPLATPLWDKVRNIVADAADVGAESTTAGAV